MRKFRAQALTKPRLKTMFRHARAWNVCYVCACALQITVSPCQMSIFEILGDIFGTNAQYRPCCMEGLIFGISMSSVIGLQKSKNQMPVSWGRLVLNPCKNSFFNPLAFITLALWPSKLAK